MQRRRGGSKRGRSGRKARVQFIRARRCRKPGAASKVLILATNQTRSARYLRAQGEMHTTQKWAWKEGGKWETTQGRQGQAKSSYDAKRTNVNRAKTTHKREGSLIKTFTQLRSSLLQPSFQVQRLPSSLHPVSDLSASSACHKRVPESES